MTIFEALKSTTENIKTWVDNNFAKKADGIPKVSNVILLAESWVGSDGLYSQVVECNGVRSSSDLDLRPTLEQMLLLRDADITLMAVNSDGIVTIYALNDKPSIDLEIKMLITEVYII